MDDTELVRRAQRGDEFAFEQPVGTHQRYVFSVAYRVLNDYAEAEHITQGAFVRAWQGLPSFRSQPQFTTWLYRIVHNLYLNWPPRLKQELLHTEPPEEALTAPASSQAELVEIREQMAISLAGEDDHHPLRSLPSSPNVTEFGHHGPIYLSPSCPPLPLERSVQRRRRR